MINYLDIYIFTLNAEKGKNAILDSIDKIVYWPTMDIPESLTTSFRNIKNIIPRHFDQANILTRRINLVIDITQIYELGARNYMVKPPGTSSYTPNKYKMLK